MIGIIGIGSPFGDDAAGLEVARRLARVRPRDATVIHADRPGAGLVELFAGATAVILIDAVHSGAPPGTLHDLDIQRLHGARLDLVSSHDLGVVQAIQLAAALDRLPLRGRLVGIEASAAPRVCVGLSSTVRAVLQRAVTRVCFWSEAYRRLAPSPWRGPGAP